MRKIKKPKQQTGKGLKKIWKFLVISFTWIALLLLSLHAFIDFFEKDIFDILVKQIEKKSAGLYLIDYNDVDLDLFKGSIHLKNLSIKLDETKLNRLETPPAPKKLLVKVSLPSLEIDGLSIIKLIFEKSLHIERLSLHGRELFLLRPVKPGQTTPILHVHDVSLLLSNLNLTSFFSCETGHSTIKEAVCYPADGFYALKLKKLEISKSPLSASLSIQALELQPRYEKYRFARVKGHQTDRMVLLIERISSKNIDVNDLFRYRSLYCRELRIDKPRLEIFRDKNIPKSTVRRPKKFPQQLLRELKLKLRIDHINISDGYVDYSEHGKDEDKPGSIFFAGIQAAIKNVGNDPESLKKKIALTFTASAMIMGKSPLTVNLSIPVADKENRFSVTAWLGKTDMKIFNSMLIPNAHLRIKKGSIDRINAAITCDNQRARGELRLFYRNLKVSLLKAKKSGEYKKRGFTSLLANFVIRRDNPKPGKPLKVGKIFYIRNTPIGFFAYIWKALLSGIKSGVGL